MARRQTRSFGQNLGLFLLVNIIPLGVAAVLVAMHLRGELEIRELPEGFATNLAIAGGALLALFFVATLCLPATHGVVRGMEGAQAHRARVLRGEAEGSKFLALLSFPFLWAAWLVAWPTRLLLVLLAFALIAAFAIFLYRAWQPEFLEAEIQRVLDWRP